MPKAAQKRVLKCIGVSHMRAANPPFDKDLPIIAIVLGIALLYVWIQNSDDETVRDTPPFTILVAKEAIPAGTVVTAAMFVAQTYDRQSFPNVPRPISDAYSIERWPATVTILKGSYVSELQFLASDIGELSVSNLRDTVCE